MVDTQTVGERNVLSGRLAIEVLRRLSVRAAPDCARFSLRIGDAECPAAGCALGAPLPKRIGRLSFAGGRTVLRLGPDEWAILAPVTEAKAIRAAFAGLSEPHSLVDTSHRDVGIDVSGPAAERTLAAVCALDLSAMPAGSATRTIFDKAPVVLVKHGPDHYRIEVWQSFATHVWGLFEAISREIALDI